MRLIGSVFFLMTILIACAPNAREAAKKEIQQAESAGDVDALLEIIMRKANEETISSYYQTDELERYSIDALAAIALNGILENQQDEKQRIENALAAERDASENSDKTNLLNNAIGLLNEDMAADIRRRAYQSAEEFVTGEHLDDGLNSQKAGRANDMDLSTNFADDDDEQAQLALAINLENNAVYSREHAAQLKITAAQSTEKAKETQAAIVFSEREMEDLRRAAAELSGVSEPTSEDEIRADAARQAVLVAEGELAALRSLGAVYEEEAQTASAQAAAAERQATEDLLRAQAIRERSLSNERIASRETEEKPQSSPSIAKNIFSPARLGLTGMAEETAVDAIVVLSKSGSGRSAYTTANANADIIRRIVFTPALAGLTSSELNELDANLSLLGVVYLYDEYYGSYSGDCEGTGYRVNAHVYVVDLANNTIVSGRSLHGDPPPMVTQTFTFGNETARCDGWGNRPNYRQFLRLSRLAQ